MHLIGTICGRTSSRRGCRNDDAPRLLDLAWTSNTDVRFRSLADILTSPRHVRFTPNNGRWAPHPRQHLVVSVTTGALFKTAPVVHKSHPMASTMIVSNTEEPRIALAKPPASALGLMNAPPAPEACDASEEIPTTLALRCSTTGQP